MVRLLHSCLLLLVVKGARYSTQIALLLPRKRREDVTARLLQLLVPLHPVDADQKPPDFLKFQKHYRK